MCRSMVDIQSPTAEIRRGKKKKKKKIERNYRMRILWSVLLHRATITTKMPFGWGQGTVYFRCHFTTVLAKTEFTGFSRANISVAVGGVRGQHLGPYLTFGPKYSG